MNKWDIARIVLILAAVVGIPWYLIVTAADGSIVAAFVLGVVVALVLAGFGFGASYLQMRTHAAINDRQFAANMRENLALMQQAQAVANGVTAQATKSAALLPGTPPPQQTGALIFDDSLFSTFED